LAFACGLWIHRHFFHDDAFVALRYAERLLAGKGLTWNDGERVEGFSSPAWLAQIVVLTRLRIPAALATQLLGLGYAFATLALWWRARAEPAGLLALATVPGFAMWTWGGLETVAAFFWILAAVALLFRLGNGPFAPGRTMLLCLSLAAVALHRPEGIVVGLSLLGAAWPLRRRPDVLIAAAALVLAFACYQVFRLLYFGDWLANAARAKTLGLPLAPRIEDAAIYLIKTAPQWLASALVAGWLLVTSPQRRRAGWLLLPCLPLLLVVLAGGGDHMPGSRFMLAPVAVLCLAASLVPPSPQRRLRRITPLLASACAVWQLQLGWQHPAPRNPAAAVGELVGRTLEATLPPGTWVAAATAGSLPYFAPSLSFIDTLGLCDRHIARERPATLPAALDLSGSWVAVPGHVRGDGAYVLSRRPDVVVLGGANGDLLPAFLGDYQLLMAKAFRENYTPWRLLVSVPETSRPWLNDQLDPASGQLPITFYLRRESNAFAIKQRRAAPLPPPWIADR
jgi:arabinofuranosyltransferase